MRFLRDWEYWLRLGLQVNLGLLQLVRMERPSFGLLDRRGDGEMSTREAGASLEAVGALLFILQYIMLSL